MSRLKELFKLYDKADAEHSPSRRSEWADCIIDELRDYVEDNRLIELIEADKDGRCVVLPCKAGDTVWDYFGMAWEITQVEHHMYGQMWFRCGHKGTDDYTAFSYGDIGERIFLTEQEGAAAKERWDKERTVIHAGVALTRSEAEVALKGTEQ